MDNINNQTFEPVDGTISVPVKEAGKMRIEGKEYEMHDGDICFFRFNV